MLKLPENNGDMMFRFEFADSIYYSSNKNWTRQECGELWQSFCNEYDSLSTEDKIKLISEEGQNQFSADNLSLYDSCIGFICAEGIYNHEAYRSYYQITDLTPETLKKMCETVHKHSPEKLPEESKVISFSLYSKSSNSANLLYEENNNTDILSKSWEILKDKPSQSFDANQPVYFLKVEYIENHNFKYDYFVFNLTEDEITLLKEIVPKKAHYEY